MAPIHISSGHARLAATVAGTGSAIVFLHAGVADRRMWQPQLDAFAATHKVVAYDRRGFGDTTSTPEPFAHVEDLEAVLQATEAMPATLVGCSMGGALAIDYALAHSSGVQALMLVGPGVAGAPQAAPAEGAIARLESEIEVAELAGDLERLNRLEAHAWLDGPACAEGRVGGPLRQLFLDMNDRALRSAPAGDQTRSTNSYARLGEIDVPTLIAVGTLDFPSVINRPLSCLRSGL